MLNSGKKIPASRNKKNKYSNTRVVRNETKNHNPPCKLNGRSLMSYLKRTSFKRGCTPQQRSYVLFLYPICSFSGSHIAGGLCTPAIWFRDLQV